MLSYYLITLLIMTAITYVIYNYDFAVSVGQWENQRHPRIPEYLLLMLASLGGGLGAWIAMTVQRHKAGKDNPHFRFVIYTSMVMNLITLIALLVAEQIGG